MSNNTVVREDNRWVVAQSGFTGMYRVIRREDMRELRYEWTGVAGPFLTEEDAKHALEELRRR